MQTKLALLGLAASANAILFPRQTTDLSPECTSAALSIYDSLPMPTGALSSAILAGSVSTTNTCTFVAPASVTKDLSSYFDKVTSWVKAESSDLIAIATKCPGISSMPNEQAAATCTALAIITPGGSGSSGSSGSSGKSAGSRSEVAIGAVLAAGLVGIMAL